MNISEALRTRINEITDNNPESLTRICLNGNLTPSTMFDFIHGKTKFPTIITLKKFCAGAEITLSDFFDREYFDDNEEIYK